MSNFALKRVISNVVTVLLAVGAAGCADIVVYPEKQDFGEAVGTVQAIQVASPVMGTAPQDGERAAKVLEAYRQDVSAPKEVQNNITINVGQ